jgi:hypothetical protein
MLEPFPVGEPVTRRGLNNLPRLILDMIRPGPGIRFMPSGDGAISISADAPRAQQGAVGGGGFDVAIVAALPPLPESGIKMVFWTSDDGGTGDDQLWVAFAGQPAYTPMQYYTVLSGVPVEA